MSRLNSILKIKDAEEFKSIIGHGQRIRRMFVTLYYLRTTKPCSAAGFSVTRGAKRAVDRNRLRRRTKEAFRSLEIKPGFDMVIVISGQAIQKNFWEIRGALSEALAKAGALIDDEGEKA